MLSPSIPQLNLGSKTKGKGKEGEQREGMEKRRKKRKGVLQPPITSYFTIHARALQPSLPSLLPIRSKWLTEEIRDPVVGRGRDGSGGHGDSE